MVKNFLTGLFLFIIFSGFTLSPAVFAHEAVDETIILMSEEGFSPDKLEIDEGTTVVFKNTGSKDYWPASNIHPTHGIYPEFDPKVSIGPNQSWSFKFDKSGTWRFHDHLNSSNTGQVIVSKSSTGKSVKKANLAKLNIVKLFSSLRLLITQKFYMLFPGELEKNIREMNVLDSVNDETKLKYYLQTAGIKKISAKLLEESENGSKIDCHQQAHKVGRVAYQVYNSQAFANMDTTCHSGFIHGAMEAFLQDKGTDNLAGDINNLCSNFKTGFSKFECLHGVGHGVMAYVDYDINESIKTCQELSDGFSQQSCYGGVFMENILNAQGHGANEDHKTQWVSDDPLFPCNAIDQSEEIQQQCYLMQTSRMLDLSGYSFEEVAKNCAKVSKSLRNTCFLSMGRDGAGQTLRNAEKIVKICLLAPSEYFQDCIKGALFVIIDFWGPELANKPHKLCDALNKSDDKKICYIQLGSRLPGLFGKEERDKIKQICEYSQKEYQVYCLNAAGINQ